MAIGHPGSPVRHCRGGIGPQDSFSSDSAFPDSRPGQLPCRQNRNRPEPA